MLLWETKNNGLFRVVRLTRRYAFKTPRVLEFYGLNLEWQRFGTPGSKPSALWLVRAWFKLFGQSRLVNAEEARTYQEWKHRGAPRIAGVALCPVLCNLPWGLLNVMPRAAEVPLNRINLNQDPFSNGAVSSEEMSAAVHLTGRNSDTHKPDTFGLINGELVVVDYGWLHPRYADKIA